MHTEHLTALKNRLANETERLNSSKTEAERKQRQVWVDSCQREIDDEIVFLEKKGLLVVEEESMTDQEILDALFN
jgi:hypothetical protein